MDEQERVFLIIYGMIIGAILIIVLLVSNSLNVLFSLLLGLAIAILYPIITIALAEICIKIRIWADKREYDSWIDIHEHALRTLLMLLMPVTLILLIFFNLSYGITSRIFK